MPAKPDSPRPMPSRRDRILSLLLGAGVAVPFAYYGLQSAAAPFVPGFSIVVTTASDLGAVGSPVAPLFNAGVRLMAIAALLAAVAAFGALRRIGHGLFASLGVAALLASLGLQTLHAGLYPMPDPRHAGPAFLLPGVLLLPLAGTWLAWRHRASASVRATMLGSVLLLLVMVPVMSGATGLDTSAWRGALQRVLSLTVFPAFGVLCALLRYRLARLAGDEGAPPPSRALPALALALVALGGLAPPDARAAPPTGAIGTPPSIAALWQRSITLGTLHQHPGQSEPDFLREAAALVDALTGALAAEVCGVFERSGDGTQLLITLMTQGSMGYCLNPRAGAPSEAGGLAGQSLHSHVGQRGRRRDDADCGGLATGLPPLPVGSPAERMARLLGDRFSERDIAAGPGFLVHRGRLWHQQGWGTQRYIARVDREADATRGPRLARWTTELAWAAACA